jgi:hypothetical protein
MAIFVSSITNAPDVDNYLLAYTAKYYVSKDVGFSTMMDFSKKIGLNFYEFKYIYLFTCISLLFGGLKIIIPNISKVVLTYLLFPFLLNVVQIRNFFIISLIIFAFAICSHIKNNLLSYILWIFFILVAATQHTVALCYLPFIFFRGRGALLFKIVPIMFLLVVLAQFLLQSIFASIMQQGLFFFDFSSRFGEYNEKMSHYGAFVFVFETLGMIYIAQQACFFNNILTQLQIRSPFTWENSKMPIYIRNLFLYGTLFWPLYVWGGSFSRLLQIQHVLLFVLFFTCFQMIAKIPKFLREILALNDTLAKITVVFILVFFRNCQTIWYSLWDFLVVQTFSNLNFLFAFFQ